MSARTKLGKSMRKKYVRGSHRDLTYVGVLLFALLVDDAIVLAEGNSFGGSFGVNRRVVSTPGFVKVSGNFSVKDFVLPKGSEGQYVSPAARPAGHNTQIQVNSKPTFYLGAQASGLPAESGYQFEWEPDAPGGLTIDPGWVIFMRWHEDNKNVWVNLTTPVGQAFTSLRETSEVVDRELTLQVLAGGQLQLTISGLGPAGTNATLVSNRIGPYAATPRPVSLYPSVVDDNTSAVFPELNEIRMRRIVGITQGNVMNTSRGFHGYPDGSKFTCQFSNGRLGKFVAQSPGSPEPKNWLWDADDNLSRVLQSTTGYDVAERIPGVRPAGSSSDVPKFKVDFPNLGASPEAGRANTTSSFNLKEGGITRYENETVRISLVSYPPAKGKYKRKKKRR